MADTYQSYSNAGQTTFSVPFPYLNKSHVKVYKGRDIVADTQSATLSETSNYTFNTSGTQITLTSALGSGEVLTVERQTPSASQLSPWSDGSNLTAEELNNADLQNLYIVQEQKDRNSLGATEARTATTNSGNAVTTANAAQATANAALSRGGGTMTGAIAMGTNKVTGVGDPTAAQDAVTKAFLERTGSIQSAQIQDGTIVNNDINSSAAIDGTKVSPNFGSQNIVTSGTVDGRDVSVDGAKLDTCDTGAKDDQNAAEIRALVDSATNSNVFTDALKNKLDGVDTGAKDDQTPAEIRTAVEAASDSNVFTNADHAKVNAAATLTGSETLTNKTLTTPVINDMSGTAVVTSGTSTSDTKTYSAKRAGEIFYGKDTVGEIQSGEAWSAADDKVATTSAIDARIIDLIDDVGGFVPIANETSFPTANPDINNGTGTLLSVKEFAASHTPSGGTVTIANGAGSGNTVTITGCGSTVLAAGFGGILETTSTLHTYTFHRLSPKTTELTTVAGNTTNINTVATNISNVNTVANDLNETTSEIDTVANAITNVNTVGNAIANVNTTATNIANINTVASDLNESTSEIDTVAVNIANVNTVGNAISNVNTLVSNMANVNNFAELYQISTTAPSADGGSNSLAAGDLWFDSSSNKQLKVHNGSAFQSVSPTQSVLNDISIVSGQITFTEDLGTITDSLSSGTGNNINTVASNIANVNTTATNISNVNQVGAISSNVTSVANAITNINTTVNNLSSISNFAEVYRIASSAPSSSLNAGDLWYDASSNVLKYYNGTVWTVTAAAGLSNIIEDTSPELGNHLDCNDKNLTEVGTISGNNLQVDFGALS